MWPLRPELIDNLQRMYGLKASAVATRITQICVFNHESKSFARFDRAVFIFVYFTTVLIKSTTCKTVPKSCGRHEPFQDKFSIFPSRLQTAHISLIPG